MKKLYLLLVFVVSCTCSLAQNNGVVDRIIEIGTTDNRSMEHLDVISNRFGGRLIGSNAYDNAVEWCATQFREWGLEVYVEEVGEVSVGFNRGPWFGRMLSDDGMILHFATPSYTSGTKGVQRGHVLAEPKTRAEFERMKGALKGAWVLIGGENNGWSIEDSDAANNQRARTINHNEGVAERNREKERHNRQNPNDLQELEKLQEVPGLFLKEMKEAGILGTIQSSKVPIRALYDRNTVWNTKSFNELPTLPDIKLDEKQYAVIAEKVRERREVILEFDIRNHFRMGPVKYHNIIGIIRGTEFPDEYVMLGGHLDAFDVATGGVDDGSGVTPVMEAARLIMAAGGRPKRSIIFCIWAGEEFGLLGSKHWVENNKDKWPKIANYFNRDSGPTAPVSITVPASVYDDMVRICEPVNRINPEIPFTVNKMAQPINKPTSAGGSDHAYFQMNGVPAQGFGLADVKGYNFDYQEIWHTERDTYNKSIPEYQKHAAVVSAVVAYGIADLGYLLKWDGLYRNE